MTKSLGAQTVDFGIAVYSQAAISNYKQLRLMPAVMAQNVQNQFYSKPITS